MIDKSFIESTLNSANVFLEHIGLKRNNNFCCKSNVKKFEEIIGFCEHLFKIIGNFNNKKFDQLVFLECSCGKSYLSFVINYLLENVNKSFTSSFYGVDKNKTLIDNCNKTKNILGYNNIFFEESRIIDFNPEKSVDIVIALHACDTATDEAIAKGMKIGAKYIVVVPCCQNQIRSSLKSGHPLTAITDFGLLRYRFSNILTDALRSQYLRGNGYSVELKEITSSRTTPKNLIIIAKKKNRKNKISLNAFNELSNIFDINFTLKEYFEGNISEN